MFQGFEEFGAAIISFQMRLARGALFVITLASIGLAVIGGALLTAAYWVWGSVSLGLGVFLLGIAFWMARRWDAYHSASDEDGVTRFIYHSWRMLLVAGGLYIIAGIGTLLMSIQHIGLPVKPVTLLVIPLTPMGIGALFVVLGLMGYWSREDK